MGEVMGNLQYSDITMSEKTRRKFLAIKENPLAGLEKINPEQLYEVLQKARLPKLHFFKTRDQYKLSYREYNACSKNILVLLHGVGEDNKYLFQLANYFSKNNIAKVYTPNLRGYGDFVERRGDVDYIGQIEDDLTDFLIWLKANNHESRIILGGHSFGGASTLRFASSPAEHLVDGYIFIAPYIHPKAPFIKKNYSKVSYYNLITLSILEKLKIRKFHHKPVYTSLKAEELRHGGEAPQLSYRMAMSRIPTKYRDAINAINKPSMAIVGGDDELYNTEKFEDVFKSNPFFTTKVLPGINHDGILFSNEAFQDIEEWLSVCF